MCMVRKQLSFLLIFVPTYCGLVWYLTSQYVPMNVLMTLQGSVVFLVIGSRVSLELMDGRMDGWMDGWMEGWMDGWMDG